IGNSILSSGIRRSNGSLGENRNGTMKIGTYSHQWTSIMLAASKAQATNINVRKSMKERSDV
ncbi:MAG: hypothetical protein KAU10_02125, partial [Dehalococcoidia bacterium]|nr:hypothetical protein [Dehalococcoidia bacterium]